MIPARDSRARRSEEALHGRGHGLWSDERGGCRVAQAAPPESRWHTPSKPAARNAFPLRIPRNFTICLPTSPQTARRPGRVFSRAIRALSARRREEDTGTTRHRMTGTIFVTAVGGAANTCGKTRPLW